MPTISRQYSYTAGDTIDPDENNANENNLFTTINALDNDNIKSGAAIAEAKLAFDTTSGHSHNGTDSRAIPKAFVFTITGTLTTGTSVAPLLVALATQTISKVYVDVKTAPTGADLIIDINLNGTSIWDTTQANRAKITDGNTAGTQTSFDTTALTEGDILTVDIDQVGSSVAGADVTITVKA